MSDASGASAEVELVQLLTPEGERVEHPQYSFDGDDEQIKGCYRDMVLTRRIDAEAAISTGPIITLLAALHASAKAR